VTTPDWNVAGLILNLIGVILLFRYGMPYRVRTGGNQIRAISGRTDEATVKAEQRYDKLGLVGLVLIVLGTLSQAIGSLFWAHCFAHFTQPCQPSPKGSSGRPAHRLFRGLLGVHSRCGLHTRAVTNS